MRTASFLLLLAPFTVAACGDDGGDDDASGRGSGQESDQGSGQESGDATIAVRLEATEGVFVEGFALGLRFTDAASGEELDRVLWSDFVASLGATELDAFYDSVLEQPVPAGVVRIGADLNVGIGPPPEPPDLDAPTMPCELEVEVAAGETVAIEVGFDDAAPGCLRIVGD